MKVNLERYNRLVEDYNKNLLITIVKCNNLGIEHNYTPDMMVPHSNSSIITPGQFDLLIKRLTTMEHPDAWDEEDDIFWEDGLMKTCFCCVYLMTEREQEEDVEVLCDMGADGCVMGCLSAHGSEHIVNIIMDANLTTEDVEKAMEFIKREV